MKMKNKMHREGAYVPSAPRPAHIANINVIKKTCVRRELQDCPLHFR